MFTPHTVHCAQSCGTKQPMICLLKNGVHCSVHYVASKECKQVFTNVFRILFTLSRLSFFVRGTVCRFSGRLFAYPTKKVGFQTCRGSVTYGDENFGRGGGLYTMVNLLRIHHQNHQSSRCRNLGRRFSKISYGLALVWLLPKKSLRRVTSSSLRSVSPEQLTTINQNSYKEYASK